jgi:hypothetical protein
LDVKVKEIGCTSGSWGLPFESGSFLTKSVNCLHKICISVAGVTLDDIQAVNQPVVKNGSDVRLEKYRFLVIAVVNAGARSTHGCAARLLEKAVVKRENVVPHNYIETFQNL